MSKLLTHGTVIRSRKIFVHLKCTILWYPSVFHFNLLNSSNQRQLSLLLLYEHLISHCSDVRISFWTVQSIVFSIFLFCNTCAKLSCKIKLKIFFGNLYTCIFKQIKQILQFDILDVM